MATEISQANYTALLDAERGLTGIVEELAKAEKCGIDCQTYRRVLSEQLATIANMKAYFAPKQLQ